MFVVLKDVFALLEFDRELVARVGVSGVAGAAQLLGLRVSGMTSGKGDGSE
jgi:hypothetical protein